MRFLLVVLVLLLAAPGSVWAATSPDELLDDPVLEARARELGKELRCLVCQNQSIDDSDAPLARDLRTIVRERLIAGDSNAEIKDFLVERYGEFVLLKPPMQAGTMLLWAGPFVVLVLGAMLIFAFYRSRRGTTPEPAPLDEDERAAVDELLRR